MKVIMYGTEICGDCVIAKEQLKNNSNIELDYRNITESTSILKEFLAYRDKDLIFAQIKEAGKIGIPLFVLEDGTKTFEVSDFAEVYKNDLEKPVTACSIDGKGQC